MTKHPTVNTNDIVNISFDDHSEGEQHIVFDVYGRVLRKDRKTILVGSFLYNTSNEVDDNTSVFTILRSTIQKLEILKKGEKKNDREQSV